MRQYAKVAPALWTGDLGQSISDDLDCLALAPYLIAGPHANMIGLYRLPMAYLIEDLKGLPSPSEALRKLEQRAFIRWDEKRNLVWVIELARHEWGDRPNLGDNRIKALKRQLPRLLSVANKSFLLEAFHDRYGDGWAELLEALPKPLPRACEGLAKVPLGLPATSEALKTGAGAGVRAGAGVSCAASESERVSTKDIDSVFDSHDSARRAYLLETRCKVIRLHSRTPARRAAVAKAIKDHGVEACRLAVRNIHLDPYWRNAGKMEVPKALQDNQIDKQVDRCPGTDEEFAAALSQSLQTKHRGPHLAQSTPDDDAARNAVIEINE